MVDEICMLRYGMILYLFLLRAILLKIVFWGLRSPQPPLWGAGKSVKPRLFPSCRIALPPDPDIRPPLPPYPYPYPFLVVIGGHDGPGDNYVVP